MPGRRVFYGWVLVVVGWVVYGFGTAPGVYTWGFLLPEFLEEVEMSRSQTGQVFGLHALLVGALGPLVGLALSRWGLRFVIAAGALVNGCGLLLMSRADSAPDAYIAFGMVAGLGAAFSTILPAQTLASNWFIRYRSRVMAIILSAGGFVGPLVIMSHARLLEHADWRAGWLMVGSMAVAVAVIAALFVRNAPEELGQSPDGVSPEAAASNPSTRAEAPSSEPSWTASQALRTPQFFLLVLCGLGYAVPWTVVITHGRLHLQDLGISAAVAAPIFSTMVFISTFGRLTGSAGDFITPRKLLGLALVVEGFGIGGLIFADAKALAYVSVVALGLGFGTAYISMAATFSSFFGRRAFATTTGTRFLISGVLNAISPALAGMASDATGSYVQAFAAVMVLSFIGATVAFLVKPPPKEPSVA